MTKLTPEIINQLVNDRYPLTGSFENLSRNLPGHTAYRMKLEAEMKRQEQKPLAGLLPCILSIAAVLSLGFASQFALDAGGFSGGLSGDSNTHRSHW